jgi:outer membrane protein assembly factor BamE (lipoprotein component of BamABCDE complex)
MKNLATIGLTFLLSMPFAYADKITDPQQINSLVKGKTTAEDVIKTFGKPEHEDHNPDGRFVYLYPFSLQGKTASEPPLEGKITFLFSSDGKLAGLKMYKTS